MGRTRPYPTVSGRNGMHAAHLPEERRFDDYVERLGHAVGHQDRHDPLRAYLTGLCLPVERKSIDLTFRVSRVHRQRNAGP